MSESTLLRAMSLFLGILLCLASMPVAFAQTEDVEGSIVEPVCIPVSNETVIHEISPSYYDLHLQQGESSSFNVNFKNNDKKALEIEPKIVSTWYSYDFDESWITISPVNVMVEPGAEQEFTIEISIPEEGDGEYYETCIAFTDDVIFYPYADFYPSYVNAMYLSVAVPVYQKLELQTSYIYDFVEAGKEYEYMLKIKNVAAKSITIDPEVTSYAYNNLFDEFGLDDDEIEIIVPSTLEAGEIADMIIRVPVPENAKGTYSGFIQMNVDGKMDSWYEPQIDLNFMVKQNPEVPYVKTFNTRTSDPITIEVSTYAYPQDSWLRISPPKDKAPSFELSLKYNSSPVDISLVKIMEKGTVGIGWYNFPAWFNDGTIYQDYDTHYVETYKVPGAIGSWELTILPKNTQTFEYSITFGDSK